MLIKIKRGWEIPERMATPEELVMNRRGLLKGAGVLALTGALTNCGPASNTQTSSSGGGAPAADTPDPNPGLYPAKRNAAYVVDRELTPENIVTSYNNYYEFGADKDDPYYYAGKLPIRPWEISFGHGGKAVQDRFRFADQRDAA